MQNLGAIRMTLHFDVGATTKMQCHVVTVFSIEFNRTSGREFVVLHRTPSTLDKFLIHTWR
jgi:hypothetical protein